MDPKKARTAAAAPPRPMELGGKTFLLSPPTDGDAVAIMAELQKHTDSPLARLASDPAFASLSPALQAVAVKEVVGAGAPTADPLALVTVLMGQPKALAFAVWLLARKNHPELKVEEIRPLITPDNVAEAFILFNDASGMADLGNSAGRPGSETAGTATPSTSS